MYIKVQQRCNANCLVAGLACLSAPQPAEPHGPASPARQECGLFPVCLPAFWDQQSCSHNCTLFDLLCFVLLFIDLQCKASVGVTGVMTSHSSSRAFHATHKIQCACSHAAHFVDLLKTPAIIHQLANWQVSVATSASWPLPWNENVTSFLDKLETCIGNRHDLCEILAQCGQRNLESGAEALIIIHALQHLERLVRFRKAFLRILVMV